MKLSKYQWRMLMTNILDIHNDLDTHQMRATKQSAGLLDAILEARNEAGDNHFCITSQLQALEDRLASIERRLPPEPDATCPGCAND